MTKNTNQRLESLDALRGFDMFWITGGSAIFVALAKITEWPFFIAIEKQMSHVPWDGFAFYDMIFPLFLFMAGVSMPFSLSKYQGDGDRAKMYRKIIKRGVVLVLLGLVYNGIFRLNFENFRYASVLGRIGLAWMFAALIFVNTKKASWRVIWCAGILLFYWLLNISFTAPDYPGAGRFTPEGNIACYIDRILLPGRLYGGTFDPEGIMGIIPAISTALLGALTGMFVKTQKENFPPMKKVLYIAAAGALLVIIAQVWNLFYPINKALWSSSFVCMAGGISIMLFALFYLVVDIWGYKKPFFYFKVIGMNSITVYLATRIINFTGIATFFFGGLAGLFPEDWGKLISSLGYVTVVWLFLYFLYKKNVFLKV
ncbi:DUF5009 domain-containing protein [Parabacteroides sp. OttesenSCG-928-G07]|nr:DUF5009 domain-containing protein [Parabacteroides sp. OttesenSCG-928-G07]